MGGVFVGRPDRTCVCDWKCPKNLLVRLPEGVYLAAGDISYSCPGCGSVIWEDAPEIPAAVAPVVASVVEPAISVAPAGDVAVDATTKVEVQS
jgi:hypothetical protein